MNREYTTLQLVSDYLGETITQNIDLYILAVQNYIEQQTNRVFKADLTENTRFFNGNDRNILSIDDCIEITKVEESLDNGATFSEIEYVALPQNYSEIEKPITQIGLRNGFFQSGVGNIKITAKWGYSEIVPDEIKLIATALVSFLVKPANAKSSVKGEKIGNYSITYDSEQQNAYKMCERGLITYRRYFF